MMNLKVLHLNVSDAGGGVGKAAFRLHSNLNNAGVDSWMYVDHKQSDDHKVLQSEAFGNDFYRRVRSHLDKIPRFCCRSEHWEYSSFNYLPNPYIKHIWHQLKPDLIHLHWIGDGFFPLQYFPLIASYPTIATLHGRWLFNGAQHLHSDQSLRYANGFLRSNRDPKDAGIDVDRWVWERKKKHFANNRFEVIALSRWMARDAKASKLLGWRNIHYLPNGLDRDVFKPFDQLSARRHFALPAEKRLVLFGANFATQDRNKGFHDFVEAIRKIEGRNDVEFEVVVFGSDRPEGEMPFQTKIHFLGYLKDEAVLASAYSACDCFVLPSHQDNLPNTVMESLSCGTPVVAYDVGGVSDMVVDTETGLLVEAGNTEQLADRIWRFLAFDASKIAEYSHKGTEKIGVEFDQHTQVQRIVHLYRDVIERRSLT